MNEETQVEQVDTDDLFDDYPEEAGTDQEAGPAEEAPGTPETDAPEESKPPQQEEPQEELYDLTDDAGTTRQVKRDELTQLAQRGMQYDRMSMQMSDLKQERDELAQYRQTNDSTLTEIRQLADMAGVDVPTYLTALQENILVSKGMEREQAKLWVQRQREQARQQAAAEAQRRQQQDAVRQRQEADIQEFVSRYQSVDPKTIPQSVWDEVRKGDTLVNAYGRYEVQQLRDENQRLQQQLKTNQKNEENKQRSVGSVSSNGQPKEDPFMSGFDSAWD
jgi:hypothetical protein